jgi:adenylyltransferase/sulfurtransferase
LTLIDRDFVEWSNLSRQVLFDESDARDSQPKVYAAARALTRINSEIEIRPRAIDLDHDNISVILEDHDLVLDGTDNFSTRYLINEWSQKFRVPWIHAAVLGTFGQILPILPGETACYRCFLPTPPLPGQFETCDTAGVLGLTVASVAAAQACEAIKLLLGRKEEIRKGLTLLESWQGSVQILSVPVRPQCPTCSQHQYPFLDGTEGQTATTLCGRNAVQVKAPKGTQLDLDQLADRLAALGPVKLNPFFLRVHLDPVELSIFPDGRVLVHGTDDTGQARNIVSRTLGS